VTLPNCSTNTAFRYKAGIPWDRHGHRHRHGHPRRLSREDVGVSRCTATSSFSLPRAGHARRSSPTCPPTCPTRALFLAMMSVRDARVYTCKRIHDKRSCTRLPNYTIGVSLMSVSVSASVSVPWNSSLMTQTFQRYGVRRCIQSRQTSVRVIDKGIKVMQATIQRNSAAATSSPRNSSKSGEHFMFRQDSLLSHRAK